MEVARPLFITIVVEAIELATTDGLEAPLHGRTVQWSAGGLRYVTENYTPAPRI